MVLACVKIITMIRAQHRALLATILAQLALVRAVLSASLVEIIQYLSEIFTTEVVFVTMDIFRQIVIQTFAGSVIILVNIA